MSATGSIACSKLLYPETKKSKLAKTEDFQLAKSKESNALEALSNGAVSAVPIVMAIIANIIVTLAVIALINDIFANAFDIKARNKGNKIIPTNMTKKMFYAAAF